METETMVMRKWHLYEDRSWLHIPMCLYHWEAHWLLSA